MVTGSDCITPILSAAEQSLSNRRVPVEKPVHSAAFWALAPPFPMRIPKQSQKPLPIIGGQVVVRLKCANEDEISAQARPPGATVTPPGPPNSGLPFGQGLIRFPVA
jgi:hypothetical protein